MGYLSPFLKDEFMLITDLNPYQTTNFKALAKLDWAVEKIILWERTVADENVIHIHGDEDDVFPIKNIQHCIVVKGGTHVMILAKYKWLNENLPKIILE